MEKISLGLDIGVNSIGWALIMFNGPAKSKIIDMGVHIFSESVEGDIEKGNQSPKNALRRDKRMIRRQLDRKRRRRARVMSILKDAGLFPNERDMASAIFDIDSTFLKNSSIEGVTKQTLAHVIPYALRKKSLDEKLSPHQLGRIFYHLAHQRGFQSSRKKQSDEETGIVKPAITGLYKEMHDAGARTLGEYFAGLNPEQSRIRGRYTHREMFKDEFEKIWQAQKEFHPSILTDDLHKHLHNALFYQRPLKSQSHLIGKCQLEPEERRCPLYRMEAQRFRIWQRINDMKVVSPDGTEETLTPDQKRDVFILLDASERVSCAEIRKLIGFKRKGSKLNFETDGERYIKGNTTNAKLLDLFGTQWTTFSQKAKDKILHDFISIEKEKTLKNRAKNIWKLNEEQVAKLENIYLEDDYLALSLKAINKLLPDMKAGVSYSTCIKQHYDAFSNTGKTFDLLPPLQLCCEPIRNPVVERSLTFTRKVVNAVISKYGKPDVIRIELARDLKRSRKEKQRRIREITQREKSREQLKNKLISDGIKPTRSNILKLELAEECGRIDPYTGTDSIGMEDLFGPYPKYDIEHIIPYSISLDDSFVNKTLCDADVNRREKRNKTPFQAFSEEEDRYEMMLQRIEINFTGRAKNEKLRRFKLKDLSEFDDFSSRHLNDTRYTSKQAMEYIALLFGGVIDETHKRRIEAVSGPVTAHVRRWYQMCGLLGPGEKTRDDHRHHAIDALAIALTDTNTIQALANASKTMKDVNRIAFGDDAEPWKNFIPELKKKLADISAVHHNSRKVRGKLHEDTIYSDKGNNRIHISRELYKLKANEVPKIVDKDVKSAVESALKTCNISDPTKAFITKENLPRHKNGTIIRRATIEANLTTIKVAEGKRSRSVKLGNNHHAEVFALLDNAGNEIKWDFKVVSMYEAYKRKEQSKKDPSVSVIQQGHGENTRYKFTLHCGDLIELDTENGGREVYIVRTIPQSKQIIFVELNEARKQKEIKADKKWFSTMPDGLRKKHAKKVTQTPFGEFRTAND